MTGRCCVVSIVIALAALLGCAEREAATIEGRPAGPYRLSLTLDPASPLPGAEIQLTWRMTHSKSAEPVTDLMVLHERVIHNFIVNLDFSSFAHIHHEDFRSLAPADLASATFTFPYRFPSAGRYRIVSEFTHGERSYTKHFDVSVGEVDDTARTATAPRLTARVDEYDAQLRLSPVRPVAGYETEMVLELARAGQAVSNLALHLGSEAHVALWRDDGRDFGHTHSYTPHMAAMLATMHERDLSARDRSRRLADMMVTMMNMPAELVYPGPRVPLRYVFPSPGLYHVFVQCAPGGQARAFHFVVEVAAYATGINTEIESMLDAR